MSRNKLKYNKKAINNVFQIVNLIVYFLTYELFFKFYFQNFQFQL